MREKKIKQHISAFPVMKELLSEAVIKGDEGDATEH